MTGLVNVPLSDTVALRASGFYRFDDGFIDSIGNNPIPSLTNPAVNIVDGTLVEERPQLRRQVRRAHRRPVQALGPSSRST